MKSRHILCITEKITGLDLTKKSRKQNYVEARAIYCMLSHQFTPDVYREIAHNIQRDHATVIHAIKMFDVYCKYSEKTKDYYFKIKSEIENNVSEVELIEAMSHTELVNEVLSLRQKVRNQYNIVA